MHYLYYITSVSMFTEIGEESEFLSYLPTKLPFGMQNIKYGL